MVKEHEMALSGSGASNNAMGPGTHNAPGSGSDRARGLWARLRKIAYDNLIYPLAFSKHPPKFDARGIALGLIIGLIVPIGGQVVILTLLRTAIRFNYLAAIAASLVSNPLNAVPLYYGYYCLGSWIVGGHVALDFSCFNKLMHPVADASSFWDGISAFMALGREILLRWCVAAVALAAVFGPLGYLVTYKIQHVRCKRAAEKMGLEYERFLEHMEKGPS
jgi:uncharacterized protein (DUF2062 family)